MGRGEGSFLCFARTMTHPKLQLGYYISTMGFVRAFNLLVFLPGTDILSESRLTILYAYVHIYYSGYILLQAKPTSRRSSA